MPKTTTVILVKDSDKKHSVKFKAVSPDSKSPPAITDQYVMRTFKEIETAEAIRVTIEIIEIPPTPGVKQ